MSQRQGNYTVRKFHDPLDDLLDRPIAFNPAFKKITGSTVAALMLSQAWYWSKRTSDEDGWFYKIGVEWEDETGLSRSEQETARKTLKSIGILEEDLRDVPARLYYRINKEKIYGLLNIQFAGIPQTGLQEPSNQDSPIPANINRNAEITTEITTLDAPEKEPDLVDAILEQERHVQENKSKAWKHRQSFAFNSTILAFADLCVKRFGEPAKKDLSLWIMEIGSWTDAGAVPADWKRAEEIVAGYTQPVLSVTGMTKAVKFAAQERKNGTAPEAPKEPYHPEYEKVVVDPEEEKKYVPNPNSRRPSL